MSTITQSKCKNDKIIWSNEGGGGANRFDFSFGRHLPIGGGYAIPHNLQYFFYVTLGS